MANFKLFVKHNFNWIPITSFESNQKISLSYATFNEKFSLSAHDVFDLTFDMIKFVHQAGIKKENGFFSILMHGTEIRLIDKDNKIYDGVVTNISYTFEQENTLASYKVQDKFSYELSNRNLGYSIKNDDENFIGALKLDSWARKIVKECRIHWNYNNVDAQNSEILRILNNDSTFNSFATFSCENVSAFDALKILGDTYGMQLKVDYSDRSFGFIPVKNPIDRGFRMNPYSNLTNLGLTTDSQSQITIMNVLGGEDYLGNPITILSEIPPTILNYFHTEYWKTSKYDNNLYNSLATKGSQEELAFLETVNHIPWLENKLINFEYFNDSFLMTDAEKDELYNLFYNDLRIINGQLIYETNNYLLALSSTNEWLRDLSINITNLNANWEAAFKAKVIDDTTETNAILEFQRIEEILDGLNHSLADRSKFLTLYRQQADQAEQDFLKNIYYFRKYWNEKCPSNEAQTNGQYYVENCAESRDTITINQVVTIKTNLTKYWNNAVTAGKYSNYYLPSDWDRTSFSNPPQNYDNPIYLSEDQWFLNDNLIPNVGVSFQKLIKLSWIHSTEDVVEDYERFTDTIKNSKEFTFDGKIYSIEIPFGIEKEDEQYNWFFQPLLNFYEARYFIDYIPNIDFATVSGEQLILTGLHSVSEETSPYYVLNLTSVYNLPAPEYQLLSDIELSETSTKNELFGIYRSKYNKILNMGSFESLYKTKKEEQNAKWLEIYRNFGDLIRENNYENKEASTSKLLLDAALQKFKDVYKPEVQYSLGMIDIYNIKHALATSIQLTDKILIEYEFFENKPTQIQNLLKEPLYITGISYSLRSDTDIEITVNSIKYTDKLISRLASLL